MLLKKISNFNTLNDLEAILGSFENVQGTSNQVPQGSLPGNLEKNERKNIFSNEQSLVSNTGP